jgi:hypothetical protein
MPHAAPVAISPITRPAVRRAWGRPPTAAPTWNARRNVPPLALPPPRRDDAEDPRRDVDKEQAPVGAVPAAAWLGRTAPTAATRLTGVLGRNRKEDQ